MNELRDVCEYGYPVWHHAEFDCLITWNGSATFLYWNRTDKGWENTNVCTVYGVDGVRDAERVASDWAMEDDAE